jgi:hypothetical protein
MAKKPAPKKAAAKKTALEFEFKSEELKKIIDKGSIIAFTAYIETGTTKSGEEVGIMRIIATAINKKGKAGLRGGGSNSVAGGPKPPGVPPGI